MDNLYNIKNLYKELKLKKVINASGRMTAIGVSTFNNEVAKAMSFAGQNYVKMDHLIKTSGELIANLLNAEEALIVSSASAGISLSIAALIHKGKRLFIERPLEAITKFNLPNEVIVLKGHNVNYGAPLETIIQIAGGQVIEAGWANKCDKIDIETCITKNTIAIVYVESHHCVQKNMPRFREVIELANKHKIPIISDVAAEENLKKYSGNKNLDFVIFSGSKAIEGPTSGIVTCKKKYISWLRDEIYGIGRSMKIGKENIIGQVVALKHYLKSKKSKWNHKLLLNFISEINKIDGFNCELELEYSRNISRAKITINSNNFTAQKIVDKLENGKILIICRKHRMNEGIIYLDPRPLKDKEYEIIIKRFKEIRREFDA